MKIQLEKPVANDLKAYGLQEWKPRRGILREKLPFRFVFCLEETLNGKENNLICDMFTRDFLL